MKSKTFEEKVKSEKINNDKKINIEKLCTSPVTFVYSFFISYYYTKNFVPTDNRTSVLYCSERYLV